MRPVSVTVFGILNLVFGLFGLLGTGVMAVAMGMGSFANAPGISDNAFYLYWMWFSVVGGLLSSIALTAAGVGLLLLQPWARMLSLVYAGYSIVSTVIGTAITWLFLYKPMMERAGGEGPEAVQAMAGTAGGVFGGCISLVFPVLLWYFMTRPRVLAAFYGQSAPPPEAGFAPLHPATPAGDPANPFAAPQVDTTHAWQPTEGTSEAVVETLVPSKNGPALASYYLGIFSLLPCLGFPMGIAAVYFGMQGLKRVKADPQVRGGVHAWVGIVCGSLFGLFNLALIAVGVLGAIGLAMER